MEHPIEFVIRAGRPDTIQRLREYASHRLSLALRRFDSRIRRVIVRVSDLNGPRRGVDSKCSITLDLIDGRRIFVNAITAWPFVSVTQAASRLNEALRREIEKRQRTARLSRVCLSTSGATASDSCQNAHNDTVTTGPIEPERL